MVLVPPALLGAGDTGVIGGNIGRCLRTYTLPVNHNESSRTSYTALRQVVPPGIGRTGFALPGEWVPKVGRVACDTFFVDCDEKLCRWADTV